MRGWRRVHAATSVAAAFSFVACVRSAGPAGPATTTRRARFILFSGSDLWRNGVFAHGGLLGRRPASTRRAHVQAADLGRALSLQRRRSRRRTGRSAPNWPARCCRAGASSAIISRRRSSSGRNSNVTGCGRTIPATACADSVRLALGDRVVDRADADDHDGRRCLPVLDRQQLFGARRASAGGCSTVLCRAGNAGLWRRRLPQCASALHVTSLKTGRIEWSAAGGWAIDTDNRASPYLRLGFMQRR